MKMRISLLLCLLAMLPSVVCSQELNVRRGDCTPHFAESVETVPLPAGRPMRLPSVSTKWDSTRVYRQAVILVSFADTDFHLENPRETYDSMFNHPGYNQRQGPGCVAEYFREQSGGLFNVAFDVYGPIKVSSKAQPYDNPTSSTHNYGREVFREATKYAIDSMMVDFSPYDWNDNGVVNQVIYVCAGLSGNQNAKASYGYVWPNTSSFSTINADGKRISNYTASCELWANGASCGIGTIIHEFTHSLGLPDIYPTTSSAGYSVMDEWDLMDGGNFINYGWCPPSYTPTEKMLLGWLTPVEIGSVPQTVRDLKPLADGGQVIQVKHTDSEYLLLENRQQTGWDMGVPGKGLLIYHVDYSASEWSGNTVNNNKNKRRFELVHADNMDYDQWYDYVSSWEKPKQYANSYRMNSNLLSTSPYPWTTDSTAFVNDSLTNNSVPAAKMNNKNSEESDMLSRSITNIRQNSDGSITFDFMADVAKCATPTISYENGRIRFACETEGVKFVSKVSAANAVESEAEEVALGTVYTVSVYAVAEGYADSDTVTATLTWSAGKMTGENIDMKTDDHTEGDVNKDGTVDVADISAVISIMASE